MASVGKVGVDSELFRGWLSDHLVKHATGARPLFLLLDGIVFISLN